MIHLALPKIFIASSSESKSLAEELKVQLNEVANIKCWFDTGIFKNGSTIVNDLINISTEYDMGIFLFNNDDKSIIRGRKMQITRDNVLFELGLFIAKVGVKKCFLFYPKNISDFHLPSDLRENFIQFDSTREPANSLVIGINQIKDSIKEWQNEKSKEKVNYYFKKFYEDEEPQLEDGKTIDYNRSFNLLLYMFINNTFKEFRALDLAFNRWEEVFKDNDKVSSQITNYSKDIISGVKSLIKDGRCTNFRRILALPIGSNTPQTRRILEKMKEAENEVKNILKKHDKNGINETRVLNVNPLTHSSEFKQHNDFAIFTGLNEEFGIVEITLTKPDTIPENPICIILKDENKLKSRKVFFDRLWENECVTISKFINENFQDDLSDTVHKAFLELANTYKKPEEELKNVSIIVETAYIELFRVGDKRRRAHIERAFELVEKIFSLKPPKDNIYICSFINDFKPKRAYDTECIDEFCEIEETDPNKFRQLKIEVAEELKKRNNSIDINEGSVGTFLMTKTREIAEKTLRSSLLQIDKKKYFEFENRPSGGRDINIEIKKGFGMNLGYDKNERGKLVIIPNCALLMAQHYYDLYKAAHDKNPSHKEFWIFDFLIHDEKIAVKQGAEAAILLHPWPKNLTLHIINCSYFDDGSGDIYHFKHKF